MRNRIIVRVAMAAAVLCAAEAYAYVEIPYALGRVINESTNIVVMEVVKVNKDRKLIYYKKIADLKGTHPSDTINHQITAGFNPREPKFIMDWAEVGKVAIFFHNGGASETCIGDYWYQSYAGNPWWSMSHSEPFMAWAYSGRTEKLRALVTEMIAGKEVVVPCAQFPKDGNKIAEFKNLLHEKKAPLWRLKGSLKLADYDAMMRERNKFVVGLGALGPEAVPGFIAQLKDAKERLKAIEELGQIGPDAKPAVGPLGELLGDSDPMVKIRTAEALLRIDPAQASALTVLTEAAKSEPLTDTVVEILGGLGGAAKPAVGTLVGVLGNPKPGVRLKAADALLKIEPANGEAVKTLVNLTETPAGKSDWAVIEPADMKAAGGAKMEKQPDKSVFVSGPNPAKDTYVVVLKTDRKTVTGVKLEALADDRLGGKGPGRTGHGNFVLSRFIVAAGEGAAAKPAKLSSAKADFAQGGFDIATTTEPGGMGWAMDPQYGRDHWAIYTLEKPIPGDVLTVTLEFQQQWEQHNIGKFRLSVTDADDPLSDTRVRAVDLLGSVGGAGKAGIPALMKVLGEPDANLRNAAATALSRMAPESIATLAAALKDPKAEIRSMALDALAQSGGHTGAAIPQLIEALKDQDTGVRNKAANVLRPFAGGAAAAVPMLMEMAKGQDLGTKIMAVGFLGDIGANAKAAIPLLIERLKTDGNNDVRITAAMSLGKMGQAAREAEPALLEILKSNFVPANHPWRLEIARAWGAVKAPETGPTVTLFEDDAALFGLCLYNGDTPNFGPEPKDKKNGEASMRVAACQRYAEFVPGWNFPIVEKPAAGQFRYIRYAWKKSGGTGIMIQLCQNGEWARRYHAGKNSVGWAPSIELDAKLPTEWTVVTRDLFKDFGAFTLTGIALTAMDGNFGLFDSMYLGRTIEDLDKVCPAK